MSVRLHMFACAAFHTCVFVKRFLCPDVQISRQFTSPFSTSERQILVLFFSHTQPLQSVKAWPLTSQGCCLCTVLLCHRRLVPLGLCTLIPLSFSRSPASVQPRLLSVRASPAPLSLSGCHSPFPCKHPIPWTSSVKTSQQKVLQPLFRHVARRPSLQGLGRKRKKMQQLNNGASGRNKKLCLSWYEASEGLFTLHDITSPLWKSDRGISFLNLDTRF